MVAKGITGNHVVTWLQSGPLMLEELSDAAKRWDIMPDWEQADWSLEWDQFMNALEHVLSPAFDGGTMSIDQRLRYQALLVGLQAGLPLIQQLNLTRPPVSLDAAA